MAMVNFEVASCVYSHTGYDVIIHFRSEVIDVRKKAENDASGGFNPESPKLAPTSTPTWMTDPMPIGQNAKIVIVNNRAAFAKAPNE